MARVEELKKLSILDVAEALGMELKRQGTEAPRNGQICLG